MTITMIGQAGELALDSSVTPEAGTPVLDQDGAVLGMVMSMAEPEGRGRVTAAGVGQIRNALRPFFGDATRLDA